MFLPHCPSLPPKRGKAFHSPSDLSAAAATPAVHEGLLAATKNGEESQLEAESQLEEESREVIFGHAIAKWRLSHRRNGPARQRMLGSVGSSYHQFITEQQETTELWPRRRRRRRLRR